MRIRIKRQGMRGALLIFCASAAVAAGASRAVAASAGSPVVVEFYTAQGCAACVDADAAFKGFVDRKGVLALTFPVDYWDYLGWRDTFAQPAFTDRQRAYDNRLKIREIYTPQIIVEGRNEAPGQEKRRVEQLVKRGATDGRQAPSIRFVRHDARVEVGAEDGPARAGEVWLVRYDPVEHEVRVKSGENKGKTIVMRNVVRELVRLGAWSGHARSYPIPKASEDGLDTAVLVQGAKGGRIIAAAKV